jgi:hypothetical protein
MHCTIDGDVWQIDSGKYVVSDLASSYASPELLSRCPLRLPVIGNGGGKIVIIKPFLCSSLLRILRIELVQHIVLHRRPTSELEEN